MQKRNDVYSSHSAMRWAAQILHPCCASLAACMLYQCKSGFWLLSKILDFNKHDTLTFPACCRCILGHVASVPGVQNEVVVSLWNLLHFHIYVFIAHSCFHLFLVSSLSLTITPDTFHLGVKSYPAYTFLLKSFTILAFYPSNCISHSFNRLST